LLISTLSSYVEAMGGTLRLVAEFPDRPPVMLAGLKSLASPK
ncbi:MAG: transcriptional regulator, partial [Magnetococcales bacterium]|nr:transcriptional regulator [Magnetococcales bacterium]